MTTQHYAAPFIAIDQVLELTDNRVRIAKSLSMGEPYFSGHYPDFPIFPGVFIFETVHQAVRHWAGQQLNQPLIQLLEAKSIRFISPLRPGDRLEVDCQIAKADLDLTVEAECFRGTDVSAAQLKLRYRLGD